MTYNEALKNLEQISEEIHRQRQQQKNLFNYEAILKQRELDASVQAARSDQPRQHFPCDIDSTDEYLVLPEKISINSSPVRQRRQDEHDCPHLLQDFEAVLTFPQKLSSGMQKSASTSATSENLFAQAQLHGPYDVKSNSSGGGGSGSGNTAHDASSSTGGDNDDNDIEQWTEIRLSHSESTSSSYSNQSLLHDQLGGNAGILDDAQSQHSSSSSDEPKRKVTCTTIFQEDQLNKKQGLSQWLSRSNSFKTSGRRQSLDLLIDAGDKVKDVFSFGFQKVGKTLERRNSESEMVNEGGNGGSASATAGAGATTPSSGEFFLFSRSSEPKELLSDEQVENLLLNHSVDENGAIVVVEELKSPLQQPQTNPLGLTTLLF